MGERLMTEARRPMRSWLVQIDGFGDHYIEAPTIGAARYRDWRQAKEAGYFTGSDGFRRYLTAASLSPDRRSAALAEMEKADGR